MESAPPDAEAAQQVHQAALDQARQSRRTRRLEGPGSETRLAALQRRFARTSRRTDQSPRLRSLERGVTLFCLSACVVSLGVMAHAWTSHIGGGSFRIGLRSLIGMTSCAALEAQSLPLPAYRGQPGYWPWLDRDKDGWACEPPPAWKRG